MQNSDPHPNPPKRRTARLVRSVAPWEIDILCQEVEQATMLHYFQWTTQKHIEWKTPLAMRFTEADIRRQVFAGRGDPKTVRKWLRAMVDENLITITKDPSKFVNGYPDRANWITVNMEEVNRRKKLWENRQWDAWNPEKNRLRPSGNFPGSLAGGIVGTERHTQQVQNSQMEGDCPSGKFPALTGSSETGTKRSLPYLPPSPQPETIRDSLPAEPGPSLEREESFLGRPESKRKTGSVKNLVWRIHLDPVPQDSDALVTFSRDRWGMRLAHLLNIQTIGHQEARSFNTRITNGTLGTLEFLWLVLVWHPRNTGTYVGGIMSLLKHLPGQMESATSPARKELDKAMQDYLITSDNPREISDMKKQIVFLCDVTKSLPMTDAQIPDMEAWASLWRCYVTLRKTDVAEADKMKARYFTHLLVQEGYPAMEEEAGQEDQPEDPEEPASELDCAPRPETAEWAYRGHGALFTPPPHPCPERMILNPDSHD